MAHACRGIILHLAQLIPTPKHGVNLRQKLWRHHTLQPLHIAPIRHTASPAITAAEKEMEGESHERLEPPLPIISPSLTSLILTLDRSFECAYPLEQSRCRLISCLYGEGGRMRRPHRVGDSQHHLPFLNITRRFEAVPLTLPLLKSMWDRQRCLHASGFEESQKTLRGEACPCVHLETRGKERKGEERRGNERAGRDARGERRRGKAAMQGVNEVVGGWLGGWVAGWLGGWVAGRLGGWAAG